MYYEARGVKGEHGLKFDPFKALIAPRPIGWVSTVSNSGKRNLAPYSFFNAVSDRPPILMFSTIGIKDSLANINENGDFTCSLATYALRDGMNMSSAPVKHGVDEFALAGLTPVPGKQVKSFRVGESPAAFECKHWKTIELPSYGGQVDSREAADRTYVVMGIVVGVYIDEAIIRDGMIDTAGMQPLARMGYMDYAWVTRENSFTLNRPLASDDGSSAQLVPGPWDGVYR
jgi:flavin reductase (DIM6/NTAB) family NADH-FMN oxidoreductase RutF